MNRRTDHRKALAFRMERIKEEALRAKKRAHREMARRQRRQLKRNAA